MPRKLPAVLKTSKLMQKQIEFPRIGLCLGGGGARGLAHILILEVFDEIGLRPSAITGTSIGALLGAGYSSGLPASRIRSIAEETLTTKFDSIIQFFFSPKPRFQKIFSIFPMRSALLDSVALLDLILPKQVPTTFEELKIPIKIVATNLLAREPQVFDSGNLHRAVAASIAIPGLFSPVNVNGEPCVDGGIVDPLPYLTLPSNMDLVIAIDVSGGSRNIIESSRPSMISTLTQSLLILQKTIIRERLRKSRPDLYLEITLENFGGLHFHKASEILAAATPYKSAFRDKLIRLVTSKSVVCEDN
ncbi:MAG TPA: hypothetical protein TECP_01103 [Hyphomicrobiaceae bacterium MAG_BT-2024]